MPATTAPTMKTDEITSEQVREWMLAHAAKLKGIQTSYAVLSCKVTRNSSGELDCCFVGYETHTNSTPEYSTPEAAMKGLLERTTGRLLAERLRREAAAKLAEAERLEAESLPA